MTATHSVELGNRSYRIFFTQNDWSELKANLEQNFSADLRYAIVTDQVIEETLERNFYSQSAPLTCFKKEPNRSDSFSSIRERDVTHLKLGQKSEKL